MKIALDWIADYLSPLPTAARAAEALMNAGLPVESVEEAAGAKGPTQVLDVEVTSNRTDCFSHVGLARELAALTGGTFTPPKIAIQEGATAVGGPAGVGGGAAVEVQDAAGCPYYSARVIRNVKVGPSPEWLQQRLAAIGLRPVNNVVDVTNYVLMELGQPLHAFDYDGLAGHRIVVRRAGKGEKLQVIDGREYALEPSMLVIADAEKPVAIAGVMGGKATEVTEQTTTVLLESARFDPLSIRTTSRALGLKSDSSYRFERGIDPTMAEAASRRAAQLILQVAGGDLAQGVVAVGAAKAQAPQVTMRMRRFREIMGISLSPDRAMAILSALGFAVWTNEQGTGEADDEICVRVPPHRLDVDREIDLIEEIARVHGYGHVPTLDRVTHAVKPEPVREKAARVIRSALVEAGFSETVTVTFIAEAEAAAFVGEGTGGGSGALIHPQHGGWKADVLRPSVLPSLLAVRRTNQYAGIVDARVFETAEVYAQKGDPKQSPPAQQRVLAAVAGDVTALTGLLPLLADRLNPQARMAVVPKDFPGFVRGAAGEVVLSTPGGNAVIGRVGLLLPELQKKYDLRQAVAGLELDWEALIAAFEPVRRSKAVPRFPGVTRDLSVVVDEAVRWADVSAAVRGAQLAFLEEVGFVTTFRNAQIGAGKKSLTLTLDFRDPARTLKSEEVDAQVAAAVGVLKEGFGAVLRA
jgi:phenylalanyl-tRNA synthetase beta chain